VAVAHFCLVRPMPTPTISPAPHLYEAPIHPPYPPVWLTGIFVLGAALAFVFLYRFRRVSLITRVGLWSLPWFPFLIASILIYGYFHPECLMDDGPMLYEHRMAAAVVRLVSNVVIIAFAIGIVLLLVAGIRRLVRLRRRSA